MNQESVDHYFPLFFIPFWLILFFLFAQLGGWARLAKKYRCANYDTQVSWQGFKSGSVGLISYGIYLWVGVSTDGLYLKTGPLFFFRAFHPPLFFPWSQIISIEERKYMWMKLWEIKLNDSNVLIKINCKNLASIAQAFLGEKLKPLQ